MIQKHFGDLELYRNFETMIEQNNRLNANLTGAPQATMNEYYLSYLTEIMCISIKPKS